MPEARDGDILRRIAREEPLSATQQAFGISREILTRILERAADLLDQAPARPVRREAPPAAVAVGSKARMRVYSDGAARGNPGPAGAGAVLVDPAGQVVDRLGKYLGVQTNNFAEYTGLLIGLERAIELGVKEIEVYADSELMIRQLDGKYQVKSPTLRPLFEDAQRLLKRFSRVKLAHVPREQNKDADEMSNRAIDERL